jgi:hypothetical protein
MNIDLRAFAIEQMGDENLNYNEEEDDVRSILMDVCNLLASKLSFSVSGFGQAVWPVDASADLPIFMEQLPSVLNALIEGHSGQIDFYEQGLERSLIFSIEGDACRVTCQSWSSWQPNPAEESLELGKLQEMLAGVKVAFLGAMRAAFPALRDHPWVLIWERGEA